jgi:hypothetical protein
MYCLLIAVYVCDGYWFVVWKDIRLAESGRDKCSQIAQGPMIARITFKEAAKVLETKFCVLQLFYGCWWSLIGIIQSSIIVAAICCTMHQNE